MSSRQNRACSASCRLCGFAIRTGLIGMLVGLRGGVFIMPPLVLIAS